MSAPVNRLKSAARRAGLGDVRIWRGGTSPYRGYWMEEEGGSRHYLGTSEARALNTISGIAPQVALAEVLAFIKGEEVDDV